MKENKEEIPAELSIKLAKNKGGSPSLNFKAKDLILQQKELKKRRDTNYHKRRKNGKLCNPIALDNFKLRNKEKLKKSLLKTVP